MANKSVLAAREALTPFAGVIVDMVKNPQRDLTARQIAVFLQVAIEPQVPCTVRGLAAALSVSKPAITRAADRLGEENDGLGLIRRTRDPEDKRSVLLHVTKSGQAFLDQMTKISVRTKKWPLPLYEAA